MAELIAIGTSIITAFGIGGPLLIWGGKIDARMAALEAAYEKSEAGQKIIDSRQDTASEQIKREFREEVRDINKKLDLVIEKIGRR